MPHSREKTVATYKQACLPVRLFLVLSPQPTKAQVQTRKSMFQLQMKKHRRLNRMYNYMRREKNKPNSSAMQRRLRCTYSLKFPPSLFPPSYSVLRCKLTTVAIFLNISLIVDCSDMCIFLHSQSDAYHASSFSLPPSVLSLLSHVCDPLLFAPSPCLRKYACWIGRCCIILPHLLPHLVLVDDCHINFSLVVVASFLSLLVYWHVVCLQQSA